MQRSLEQRRTALKEANRCRISRADLKRDVKAGKKSAVEIVLSPPSDAVNMKIRELLLSVPKVGPVKAHKVLVESRVSPSKTLGGMTKRQRDELATRLQQRGTN